MKKELDTLLNMIANNYAEWTERFYMSEGYDLDVAHQRVQEFADGLVIEEGRKYYKVIKTDHGRSVWGFVVKGDNDKLFKKGDILKAAGWKAPARNKARGNVLEGDFSMVRWTGPAYLY
jgi:hypothetical protein